MCGQGAPRHLSTHPDPLFEAHRWTANLRILEIDEIKTVPHVLWSQNYNAARSHASLEGHTPMTFASGRRTLARADLNHVRWSPTAGTWSNSQRRPDNEFETDRQRDGSAEFWDSSETLFARKAKHANERVAEIRSRIEDLQSRGVAQPGSAPALGQEPAESWPAFRVIPRIPQRIRTLRNRCFATNRPTAPLRTTKSATQSATRLGAVEGTRVPDIQGVNPT
jgi:hypothetical protein